MRLVFSRSSSGRNLFFFETRFWCVPKQRGKRKPGSIIERKNKNTYSTLSNRSLSLSLSFDRAVLKNDVLSLPLFRCRSAENTFCPRKHRHLFQKILRGGYKKRANTQKKSKTLTVQRSRHNWFCTRESASLGGEKKRTFGERGARAHHVLRHVPHFIRVRVVMFPFLGLLLFLETTLTRTRSRRREAFFRLSFSQRFRLCSTKLFPKKRFFLRARTSFWCARVCSRRTQSDRDLLPSSSCARFTPRDRRK